MSEKTKKTRSFFSKGNQIETNQKCHPELRKNLFKSLSQERQQSDHTDYETIGIAYLFAGIVVMLSCGLNIINHVCTEICFFVRTIDNCW